MLNCAGRFLFAVALLASGIACSPVPHGEQAKASARPSPANGHCDATIGDLNIRHVCDISIYAVLAEPEAFFSRTVRFHGYANEHGGKLFIAADPISLINAEHSELIMAPTFRSEPPAERLLSGSIYRVDIVGTLVPSKDIGLGIHSSGLTDARLLGTERQDDARTGATER